MPLDEFTTLGDKVGSTVTLREPVIYREALRTMPDGVCAVTVGQVTARKRGLAANNYYWLFISALAKDTGQDKDDIHDYLKSRFLTKPVVIVDVHGQIVEERTVVRSTTECTPEEFSAYVDRCKQCGAEEFGFVLPDEEGRVA